MDAMMMIQAQATSKATVPGTGSGRAGGEPQGTFAQYMDRKLNEDLSRERLLGVKPQEVVPVKNAGAARETGMRKEAVDMEDAQTLVALLSQFLQDLKSMSTDSEKTAGDWSFSLPDNNLLQKIAADAGMDAKEMAALLQQFEDQDGVIDLQNFLATLTRHFDEQGKAVEVMVPETDLPFFETLLSKMGVPVEEIVDVGDKSVTGDGQLNLATFMEALQNAKGNDKPIQLSDLEITELRDIFSEIGVADALQNRLLPENEEAGLPFSLDRLRDVLQQGIANVQDNRPKLDLPMFLQDLQQIFAEAQFNEKNLGWSPAVQNAVSAAYEELLKSVDLSTVQVKVVQAATGSAASESDGDVNSAQFGKSDAAEIADSRKIAAEQRVEVAKSADAQAAEVAKSADAQAAEVAKSANAQAAEVAKSANAQAAEVAKPVVAQAAEVVKPAGRDAAKDIKKDLHGLDIADEPVAEEKAEVAAVDAGSHSDSDAGMAQERPGGNLDGSLPGRSAESHAASAAAAGRHVGFEQQVATVQGRAATPAPQMTPGLEQQTFQHISNSVLNGLKNDEHHLVLRLFPRELGEVKVEMTVREQNISLSFSMENHRVKETLESNMQQFQDNLARQGFNLQGCEVNVGQQNEEGNAAWQAFEQARQQQGQGKNARATLADLPGESMYIRPIHGATREGGISLFI